MTIHIGWPQFIYIVLSVITTGVHAVNHGKQREDKYDFWMILIAEFLVAIILWWGGFFTC